MKRRYTNAFLQNDIVNYTTKEFYFVNLPHLSDLKAFAEQNKDNPNLIEKVFLNYITKLIVVSEGLNGNSTSWDLVNSLLDAETYDILYKRICEVGPEKGLPIINTFSTLSNILRDIYPDDELNNLFSDSNVVANICKYVQGVLDNVNPNNLTNLAYQETLNELPALAFTNHEVKLTSTEFKVQLKNTPIYTATTPYHSIGRLLDSFTWNEEVLSNPSSKEDTGPNGPEEYYKNLKLFTEMSRITISPVSSILNDSNFHDNSALKSHALSSDPSESLTKVNIFLTIPDEIYNDPVTFNKFFKFTYGTYNTVEDIRKIFPSPRINISNWDLLHNSICAVELQNLKTITDALIHSKLFDNTKIMEEQLLFHDYNCISANFNLDTLYPKSTHCINTDDYKFIPSIFPISPISFPKSYKPINIIQGYYSGNYIYVPNSYSLSLAYGFNEESVCKSAVKWQDITLHNIEEYNSGRAKYTPCFTNRFTSPLVADYVNYKTLSMLDYENRVSSFDLLDDNSHNYNNYYNNVISPLISKLSAIKSSVSHDTWNDITYAMARYTKLEQYSSKMRSIIAVFDRYGDKYGDNDNDNNIPFDDRYIIVDEFNEYIAAFREFLDCITNVEGYIDSKYTDSNGPKGSAASMYSKLINLVALYRDEKFKIIKNKEDIMTLEFNNFDVKMDDIKEKEDYKTHQKEIEARRNAIDQYANKVMEIVRDYFSVKYSAREGLSSWGR